MEDWSRHWTKAEQALKKGTEYMLIKDYEQGAMELLKAKAYLDAVMLWIAREGK